MATLAGIASGADNPTVGGSADIWGNILNAITVILANEHLVKTANLDFADFILSRAEFKDYCETVQVLAYAAAPTIDLANGNHVTTTLSGNITTAPVINNVPPSGKAGVLRWRFKQDGTGNRTIIWPSSFKWQGIAPALSTTAGATDTLTAITYDGGTAWEASLAQGYSGL